MIDDTVDVERTDILRLVAVARDYGFEDDVLFEAFGDWLDGEVYDDNLNAVADMAESEEGRREIMDRLNDFLDEYGLDEAI